jgi:hypothetical protein
MRTTGYGELNDHEAIVPLLKEVGREPLCRSHAAATSQKEGQLGVIREGGGIEWMVPRINGGSNASSRVTAQHTVKQFE